MIGLALIVGAAEFSQRGVNLFGNKKKFLNGEEDALRHSINGSPKNEQCMPFSRF